MPNPFLNRFPSSALLTLLLASLCLTATAFAQEPPPPVTLSLVPPPLYAVTLPLTPAQDSATPVLWQITLCPPRVPIDLGAVESQVPSDVAPMMPALRDVWCASPVAADALALIGAVLELYGPQGQGE